MKTTLKDLNNHLFEMMEKIKDEGLKGDELKEELARAQIVDEIAGKIIDVHALNMKTAQFFVENGAMTAKEAIKELGAKTTQPFIEVK
ncbi:hypothetical protein [Campylobacter mucosalis]|uniref:Phage protein n=1 Tax=Campylobacter mucosalis CCUG 21559 TaxID=1032067 RepID=A0A6G5QHG5_9BACT|nr:hypothetical protein [Campylobacter mucosalis]QCD44946.1 hypothetical protein CMUC_1172 [Campylobacter mucosalis CCUG 21559]